MRFALSELLRLTAAGGDQSKPLVVPAVGLGYATSVLGELVVVRSVPAYPGPESGGVVSGVGSRASS